MGLKNRCLKVLFSSVFPFLFIFSLFLHCFATRIFDTYVCCLVGESLLAGPFRQRPLRKRPLGPLSIYSDFCRSNRNFRIAGQVSSDQNCTTNWMLRTSYDILKSLTTYI